jgi:zinc transporter 5/7
MASTYALPLNPAAQTRHGHSRSQLLPSQTSSWNGQVNGAAPTNGHAPSSSHRHYKSEVNGQLHNGQTVSPYADSHERSHSHSHDHSHNRDRGRSSEFSLKPFMPGRPKIRPRGESDLGRPPSRTRTTTAGKFGAFSPIQEGPPSLPLPAS